MSDNVLNPYLTIDQLKRLQYQSRVFVCGGCGITFEIYSDSPIARVGLCSECNNKTKGEKR